MDSQNYQEEIVLFKFKRALPDESFDQIKIQSKKLKPNHQSIQKATQKYQNNHFLDRQTILTSLFQKLQLNQKQPYTHNQTQTISPSNQQNFKKTQFFLKKIDLANFSQDQSIITEKNQHQFSHIRTQAKSIRMQVRREAIEKKFDKVRQINQGEAQTKRIKYKIIDIKKQNIVNFNGQRFEYQDLFKQQNQIQKQQIYDYYILTKGKHCGSSNQPEIILPQEVEYLLEQEYNNIEAQTPQDSQDDSNREDRSDYDYPEEQYHEGDSDKQSESLISEDRRSERSSDGDEDMRNSYNQEDEEEYYRQYLKRCKRREQGDDELTYLYSLKAPKYDEEDSDD